MVADINTFRLLYPQFADETQYTDERVQLFIDLSNDTINECVFEEHGALAVLTLSAHLLTLQVMAAADPQGGSAAVAGPVTSESESVGGVSISRSRSGSTITTNMGTYGLTLYGQQYWQWLRACLPLGYQLA